MCKRHYYKFMCKKKYVNMNKSNFVILFRECGGSEKSRVFFSLKEETSPVPGDHPPSRY
jgi:hypothetical protein